MKYMRQPNGQVKPILDIYETMHNEQGWATLEGQDLSDYLAEEACKSALRVKWRVRGGAVPARKLSKAEEEAIVVWEKRSAQIEAEKAAKAAEPKHAHAASA